MAVIGTFGSFTAARLGIYASQASLSATGNNIANINTVGYTRQRMDLVSLYSYGTARYANNYQQNIGYGVLTSSVSQLRDPFLDIRYREENASTGAYEAKLDCLQQLSQILDEVGKGNNDFGIIEAQFNDFFSQLENLNGKVGAVDYDTTVRGSAQTLTRLLNDYAKAMETLSANKLNELKENIKTVNDLLVEIRDLSVQIRDADIVGDNALELRDARNLCIDQLSSYMKIDVRYDQEKIDEWNSVERINISISGSNPPIKLIQGIYGAQISMPETAAMRNPNYKPDLPTSNRYISQESDFSNPAKPKIVYTNIAREALVLDGQTVTNDAAGQAALQQYVNNLGAAKNPPVVGGTIALQMYDPSLETTGKYVQAVNADGTYVTTDDENAAMQVDNAVEGSKDNRLWMTVQPLKDAKDRYMRDANHRQIRESVDLSDNQLYGSLQSIREFLTEKGEFSSPEDVKFDEFALQKRGVQYYQNALDALAKKFAETFNKANRLDLDKVIEAYKPDPNDPTAFLGKDGTSVAFEDSDGNPILDSNGQQIDLAFYQQLADDIEAGNPIDEKDIEAAYAGMEVLRQNGELTDRWSFYNGGVLFSNNGDTNDPTGITAKNITISAGWTTGNVRLLNTKKADDLDHSTANDNILHMIELMSEDMDYYPGEVLDGTVGGTTRRYFTGSFQERLSDMNNILGEETKDTALLYNNYTATTLSLENSRQSVAGVDLNDEAMSMMVFQKSYAAACQLMTTLDSMLDKLINGTLR